MDKKRYEAARPIFEAALDLPADDRTRHVQEACGDDDALRSLVLDLLGAHDESLGPLRGVDQAIERSLVPDEQPGSVIDRYTLLEPLGEGGFGVVWRAEQHEPIHRDLALKILKLGMDSRQVVARFEAERQALALMDHPHIARVYDGGTTQRGRPYFAMELVQGRPITQYCTAEKLSLPQRLNVFIDVCDAIQHAHQKGIIHRDVKPSNVLIAQHQGKAFPKVIDFGIAKAVSNGIAAHTMLTEHQQVLGTPEYMAPEQIQGNTHDIDTRADVYSLGVLLYELLTGTRPFNLRDQPAGDVGEVIRAICEVTPPKPSTRASTLSTHPTAESSLGIETRHLSSALKGDLDWIAMRALEKERDRRYDSVTALAADVRHYLNKEPVSAGPPSARYRARKFVQRHRATVTAAFLVMSALIAGLVGTGLALRWALEENTRANDEAVKARDSAGRADRRTLLALDAIDEFYTGVSREVLLEQPALESLRKRLLRSPMAFYERLQADLAAQTLPSERTSLAQAFERLGDMMRTVGSLEEAIVSYGRAASIWKQLAAEGSDIAHQARYADVLGLIGQTQSELGRLHGAEVTLGTALEALDAVRHQADDPEAYAHELAELVAELGTVHEQLGRPKDAIAHWLRSLQLLDALEVRGESTLAVAIDQASTHGSLGRMALNAGDAAAALSHFQSQRDLLTPWWNAAPDDLGLTHRLATAHQHVANASSGVGDEATSRSALEQAIALDERVVEALPTVAAYRTGLGNAYNSLAGNLADRGESDAAEQAWTRSHDLLTGLSGVEPRRILAVSLRNHADLLIDRGESSRGLKQFERAAELHRQLEQETDDPKIRAAAADCFNNYAMASFGKRPQPDCAHLLRRSIHLRRQVLTAFPDNLSQHVQLLGALTTLGRSQRDEGALNDAVIILDEAAEWVDSPSLPDPTSTLDAELLRQVSRDVFWARANAFQMLDEFEQASEDWLRAASLDDGAMRAQYLTQRMGDLARGGLLGDPAAAVTEAIEDGGATPKDLRGMAIAILQTDAPGAHPLRPVALVLAQRVHDATLQSDEANAWRSWDLLAWAYLRNGQLEQALHAAEQAIAGAPTPLAPDFQRTLESRRADVRRALGSQ